MSSNFVASVWLLYENKHSLYIDRLTSCFYGYSVKLLCTVTVVPFLRDGLCAALRPSINCGPMYKTMIVVFNWKLLQRNCNSVEFNGQTLSKLSSEATIERC